MLILPIVSKQTSYIIVKPGMPVEGIAASKSEEIYQLVMQAESSYALSRVGFRTDHGL